MWLTIVDSLLVLDNLSLGLFGSLTFLWLSSRYDVILSFLFRQLTSINDEYIGLHDEHRIPYSATQQAWRGRTGNR